MSITLGVFDVFAYATPGSIYLALSVYVATRLNWVDPLRMLHANATLTIIIAAVASYILGHITYTVGQTLSSRLSVLRVDLTDIRRRFVDRVPVASNRPFLAANQALLRAAVELHNIAASAEIARLQAIGLMLRNSAPPLIIGSVAAIIQAATGRNPVFAACCAVALMLAAAGCLFHAERLHTWSVMKTLELAFWVPDIDKSANSER